MKLQLNDLDFSKISSEKTSMILLVKMYEIRNNLQNSIEELQLHNETRKKEDGKMKIKSSVMSSLSNVLKELKDFSSAISKIYAPEISEKEVKSFYEMQKMFSEIPKESIEKFTGEFLHYLKFEDDGENKKSGS